MINIAILEDSDFDRHMLCDCLKEYAKESVKELNITCFKNAEEMLENYSLNTDILFLDIMLDDMNGVQAARNIRRKDSKVIIIFCTSMIQCAVHGYSVDALDFIIKPAGYTAVRLSMDRALRKLEQKNEKRIEIKGIDGSVFINANSICYVETFNHKVIVHTTEKVIPANMSMAMLEKALQGLPFFRCHTSFLVNLMYVDKVSGNDVWVNSQMLSISRYRRREFLSALSAYLMQ